MDSRPNRRNKAVFSEFSGEMRTLSETVERTNSFPKSSLQTVVAVSSLQLLERPKSSKESTFLGCLSILIKN